MQKRLTSLLVEAWMPLLFTIAAGLAGGVLLILQARLITNILNGAFINGQLISELLPLFWVVVFVIVSRSGLVCLGEVASVSIGIKVKKYIRNAIMQRLVMLGPSFRNQEESGELSSVVSQGVENLEAYFSQYLPQLIFAVMIPVAILVSVFPLDLLTFTIFLITAPLIPLFMYLIGKGSEQVTRKQFSALGRMSAYFLDTLKGLIDLKLLGVSRERAARVDEINESYRKTTLEVLKVTFLSAFVLELVGTLSTAIVAVEIGLRVLQGTLLFDQAFFILIIAPEFYLPLRLLAQRFHAGNAGAAAATRIFAILDLPMLNQSTKLTSGSIKLPEPPYLIELKGVSFRYPGRDIDAINDVSCLIPASSQTALLGKSGSGKSTILNLLLGFYRPTSGKIMINETPLDNVNLDEWRSKIAWVPQNPFFFRGTIQENLLFAKNDATLEDQKGALKAALLDEFMPYLDEKIKPKLGDQGSGLSGGQLQRLALARAFLKNSPLLIMDEPTSNLDPENEEMFKSIFQKLACSRTVLIIAHRLPTIYRSNHVILLQDGTVIEMGEPSKLIQKNGVYGNMIRRYGAST